MTTKNTQRLSLVLAIAVGVSACATASGDIAATYVSPLQYQGYDCNQIRMETQRVQHRVVALGGQLDEAASNDKAITGIGIILFWPALFALGGDKAKEAEYGRLKGEYEALQQASIQGKCHLQYTSAPSTTPTDASAPVQDSKAPITLAPAVRVDLVPVAGNVLQVGNRSLALGKGHWFQFDESRETIAASSAEQGHWSTINGLDEVSVPGAVSTVLQVAGAELSQVLVMQANTVRKPGLRSWRVSYCDKAEGFLTEQLARPGEPNECIRVRTIRTVLPKSTDAITPVLHWATASGLKPASQYYEISYYKLAASGYLGVTAYEPSDRFASESGALHWGRSLALSLRPLANEALAQAYLPDTL